jgi:hypothetical protein
MSQIPPVSAIPAWFGMTVSMEVRLIVFTVVAVALAWTGLLLWDRHRKQAALRAADPNGLFESLCLVHHLSDAESGVLRRLVTTRQLAQPGAVFVDPSVLRDAAAHREPGCAALLRRLFGDLADASHRA